MNKINRNSKEFKCLDRYSIVEWITPDLPIVIYDYDLYQEPHFHILSWNEPIPGTTFNCRVKIQKPDYLFVDDSKDILTSTQIDQLITILKSSYMGINNWNQLISNWENFNCNIGSIEIPNYSKLKDFKNE